MSTGSNTIGYAYNNAGTSWRYSYGNDLVAGEAWFQYQPDPMQLATTFSGYAAQLAKRFGNPIAFAALIASTPAGPTGSAAIS